MSPAEGKTSPRLTSFAASFTESELLIGSISREFPTSVVSMNAQRLGLGAFAGEWLQDVYAPVSVSFDPIQLGRLPEGSMIIGGNCFWLEADGALVIEQLTQPLPLDIGATYAQLRSLPFDIAHVNEPVLLVARYGEYTWGHWLAELLPRAALVEASHPGRFKYLMPNLLQHAPATYRDAVAESLAAYGISPDRLITLRGDYHYRFKALYAVSGLWTGARPHPGMLEVMRRTVSRQKPSSVKSVRRLAMLRRDAPTRKIHNAEAVEGVLRDHGFSIAEMGTLAFADQVAAFASAEHIFGVLGSGLSGLVYAPQGVRVAGAGPGAWRDAYFYPFVQEREGWFADLRGPVLWDGNGLERDAPFVIFLDHLAEALSQLERPESELAPEGWISIGNTTLPRRLGTLEREIRFIAGSDGARYHGVGWDKPESAHTWTLGPVSTLHLPAITPGHNYVLELIVTSFNAPPHVVSIPLTVAARSEVFGRFAVRKEGRLYCRIPQSCLGGEALELTFGHPHCFSARQLYMIPDDRQLGMGFRTLRIWRIDS